MEHPVVNDVGRLIRCRSRQSGPAMMRHGLCEILVPRPLSHQTTVAVFLQGLPIALAFELVLNIRRARLGRVNHQVHRMLAE